jgi:putative sterol carrier protein
VGVVTEEFLAGLDGRHEPLLEQADGTLRFDLVDGTAVVHRYVRIADGDVAVLDSTADADCVVRGSRALFDEVGSGRSTAMMAYLRGELTAHGDLELLVLFQRMFPRGGGGT